MKPSFFYIDFSFHANNNCQESTFPVAEKSLLGGERRETVNWRAAVTKSGLRFTTLKPFKSKRDQLPATYI